MVETDFKSIRLIRLHSIDEGTKGSDSIEKEISSES